MDMVCEKNSDVDFDFETQPIRTVIDGDWVRAEGTTLGADCGIGMAAAMALLLDEQAEHGPIEALFTVDEETGLTGAFNLGEGMLNGRYLINLDSEDEGEIFIGCAGGIDTIATYNITLEQAPKDYLFGKTAEVHHCDGKICRAFQKEVSVGNAVHRVQHNSVKAESIRYGLTVYGISGRSQRT